MTDEKALEISELIQKKRDLSGYLDYYNKENVKFCIYINLNEMHIPMPLTIKTNRYFLQDEIKEFVSNKIKKELEETDIKLKNINCEQ